MTEANALLLCLAKGSHMVTMEICSYTAAVSVASLTFSPPLTVKNTTNPHTKAKKNFIFFMFCDIIFSLSEYLLSQNVVENCVEPLTCPMPNIFFFPFRPQTENFPSEPNYASNRQPFVQR